MKFLATLAGMFVPVLIVLAAVSAHGTTVSGVPVIGICVGVAFLIQWVAFIPAYRAQTERYFDLTGSITYLTVIWLAVGLSETTHPRALLLATLVSLWAIRLGSFLFQRIRQDGHDGRFDEIRPFADRFFITWTLQGTWVTLTAIAALTAITTADPSPLGWLDALGLLTWLVGMTLEATADRQKRAFRRTHPGRFIDTGLWARSRHPNYFGEIVLWVGVAVCASSTLTGPQWVAWISPVFVTVLLTRISGIPLLHERAEARWGDDPAYRAYRDRTPVLIPSLRRPASGPRD